MGPNGTVLDGCDGSRPVGPHDCAFPMSDDKHGGARRPHDAFGHAPKQQMGKCATPVGADDDHVDVGRCA
jgi:hypothetical protein